MKTDSLGRPVDRELDYYSEARSEDFETVNLFDHKDGPLVVTWDTGRRCNYDCTYCSIERHDNYSPHASLEELQGVGRFLFDYSELLCKYKTKDQVNVSFTGGEPTVNPKFIEFGQWLRKLYNNEYKNKFKLNLGLTTNGAFSEKMAQSILEEYDSCTISYHVEAHKNLKKQVIRNIYFLKEHDYSMKVNVMFHAQYFDECVQLCQRLQQDNIAFVPRMIGEEGVSPDAHVYSDEQLKWMKDYWKDTNSKIQKMQVTTLLATDNFRPNKLTSKRTNSRNFKQMNTTKSNTLLRKTTETIVTKIDPTQQRTKPKKGEHQNIAEALGRPCCGSRVMETCSSGGCLTKTKFLDYQKFRNWQCSVNWFFLHIEQQTDKIFHHQTCQARFDGTRGPIGSISESDKILDWLRDKLETNTMPIIKCPLGPNKLCGCGLCSPKSTDLQQLKNILPRHINNMDIFI